MAHPLRILVAGGAGFVGSRLVPHLASHGHKVTVVDELWFGNNLPAHPGVEVKNGDLINLKKEELKGFDQVIFLGGLSNDPMAEYSPRMNFISNSAGPAHLAYYAKRAGVRRFIYASSCSVYGDTGNRLGSEETRPTCTFPYGVSKLQGEVAVMQMASPDFSVISLRSGTTNGWSPRLRFDLLINALYMSGHSTGSLTVSNPAIWRPILAMSDSIEAYRKAVEAPQTLSGVFNVCSENVTLGEAAERVRQYFRARHGREVAIAEKHIADVRNYKMSNQRAQDELGVRFTGTIESILAELDEHGSAACDFGDDAYHNVRTFKKRFREA